MDQVKQVLIVEDEPKIAQILVDVLTRENYSTSVLHDGLNAVEEIKTKQPDFVILDIMLPNKDGLSICKEVRTFSDVPIMMLTARIDEIDRLIGLDFGADDYVCKPFSAREVVARVKTILRRSNSILDSAQEIISYQQIHLNLSRHQCKVHDKIVDLTPVEFRLLHALINKPGLVFSRDKLMNHCYEDERIVSQRTIDSHMKNLRSKISVDEDSQHDEASSIAELHSIYGIGYKIE